MDKKNLLVIGAVLAVVLLACAALFTWGSTPPEDVEGDCVIVHLNGEEYARIPLSEPQEMTIRQDNGAVNVVQVTEKGMRMLSSTCPNHDCVKQGEITLQTMELLGHVIVCIPNGVTLELVDVPEVTEPSAGMAERQ